MRKKNIVANFLHCLMFILFDRNVKWKFYIREHYLYCEPNGDEFVITVDRNFLSVHMVDFTCTLAKIDIYHGIFAGFIVHICMSEIIV